MEKALGMPSISHILVHDFPGSFPQPHGPSIPIVVCLCGGHGATPADLIPLPVYAASEPHGSALPGAALLEPGQQASRWSFLPCPACFLLSSE